MKPSMAAACAAALLLAATLAAPVSGAPPARSYLPHAVAAGAQPLPFSDAVRSGDTLYVAGHLGIDPHTGDAAADSGIEARLVMEAVKHTVEAGGLQMDDLVSVTVYCTDLRLFEAFNAVYRSYFHDGHYPARAFIGVAQLLRGARFEVSGIAVAPRRDVHH
jgi:2-iminobutanoate/2-iminopropanoate deaminase